MELAAKVLCNPDDVILCEDPSFVGSLNCFRSLGARLVGVPMQRDGLDVDQLEQKLKSEKNVRALYTIPNFQNPTARPCRPKSAAPSTSSHAGTIS